ncbi:MAG: dihydrolipoyl dehydrogenase [Promethearchaeota archaeon]
MSEEELYDIVVIGAGSGGYHAALRAAQYGAKVAIIERDKVGGTCLNRGCIPTKALYSSVKLLEEIKEKAKEFGIEGIGTPSPNFTQMVERKNKVVKDLVEGIEGLLKARKIPLLRGHGKVEGRTEDGNFIVTVSGQDNAKLACKKVILATGSKPALIPAFNIDHEKILTSDDILDEGFKTVPERLLIIGAGVIGCEFANIFANLGAKVIMLEYLPTMLATEEKLVIKELMKKFKKLGIELHTSVNVLSVQAHENGVTATVCDAGIPREQLVNVCGEEYHADICLVSIGRARVSDDLGIEELGVKVDRGQISVNPKTLETDAPGIYAVGDVTGGIMLAHVAYYDANVAVANALSAIGGFDTHPAEANYDVVPYTIFTSPEVGSVGLREKAAKKKVKESGGKVYTGRFAYGSLGKAKAMGEENGFMMVVAEATSGKILGATCIGHEAPELISDIALAMKNNLTTHDVAQTIYSHPTISEMVLETVEDVYGMAIHKAGRRRK